MGLDINSNLGFEPTNVTKLPDKSRGGTKLRVDATEVRFDLHRRLEGLFPNREIFDEFQKIMEELDDSNGKFKLRSESCRFGLLQIDSSVRDKIKDQSTVFRNLFGIHKNSVLRSVFEQSSHKFILPEEILRIKGWSPERSQKFLARVAERIWASTVDLYPDKVPSNIADLLLKQTCEVVTRLYLNREAVAKEYVIQSIESIKLAGQLPKMEKEPSQSATDLRIIDEAKKLSQLELATKVLKTVRKNTERVRGKIIPDLLSSEVGSQFAFWAIHAGEFDQDPFAAQLLSVSSEAKLMDYASSIGGEKFYKKNVGSVRQVNVSSGGISHVDPKYLPELQIQLFSKIDSYADLQMSEEHFLEFATQVDLVMYALHLPFDGSGRAIEDFIFFLSKKYGYPVTFSVLGYRDAGSPLMPVKEEVGPMVKKEINRLILHNLGIESEPVRYDTAIDRIREKFDCGHADAWLAYDSELALITCKLINSIGTPDFESQIAQSIPSFSKLRYLWTESRKLRFINVPDNISEEVDRIVAMIGTSQEAASAEGSIFERISMLQSANIGGNSEVISLINTFALSKKTQANRSLIEDLYRGIFSGITIPKID